MLNIYSKKTIHYTRGPLVDVHAAASTSKCIHTYQSPISIHRIKIKQMQSYGLAVKLTKPTINLYGSRCLIELRKRNCYDE